MPFLIKCVLRIGFSNLTKIHMDLLCIDVHRPNVFGITIRLQIQFGTWDLIQISDRSNHIRTKRQALNARTRSLGLLLIENNFTCLKTKLFLHKTLVKPIWTYGLRLWGSTKKYN